MKYYDNYLDLTEDQMRLGIVSDIHECVGSLKMALGELDSLGIDQIVVLGDLMETGKRIEVTVSILADRNIVGVWGNHDLGLSLDPCDEPIRRYPASLIQFMTGLKPRVVVAPLFRGHFATFDTESGELRPQKVPYE
jgi:hypothetical protein